ncbi:L-asparaginase 1 [compost metagenome]
MPVVLTGAMLPAGTPDSDAWPNLLGAIHALRAGVTPGVHLFFNGQLLHGTRASKLRSEAFDAFTELPRPREGERATTIPAGLDYRTPRQPVNLVVLPLFPGLAASHVDALLGSGVRGLLLECYGSGTGPSDDQELLAALRAAHRRGVVLAASSQCPAGHVQAGVYAAGSQLLATGLVPAGGMTREAALGKLFALLGAGLRQEEVEQWFGVDLCGEMVD